MIEGIISYIEPPATLTDTQRECYRSCVWFFVIEKEYVIEE
ncbi:MAG: hypothetical protein ABIL22_03060 [candidate division WOR-3 bacterium]